MDGTHQECGDMSAGDKGGPAAAGRRRSACHPVHKRRSRAGAAANQPQAQPTNPGPTQPTNHRPSTHLHASRPVSELLNQASARVEVADDVTHMVSRGHHLHLRDHGGGAGTVLIDLVKVKVSITGTREEKRRLGRKQVENGGLTRAAGALRRGKERGSRLKTSCRSEI